MPTGLSKRWYYILCTSWLTIIIRRRRKKIRFRRINIAAAAGIREKYRGYNNIIITGLCRFWPLRWSSPSPKFVIGSLRDHNIILYILAAYIYFVGNNCVPASSYAHVVHRRRKKTCALSVFRIFHLRAACVVVRGRILLYYVLHVLIAVSFSFSIFFFLRRKSCLVIFPIWGLTSANGVFHVDASYGRYHTTLKPWRRMQEHRQKYVASILHGLTSGSLRVIWSYQHFRSKRYCSNLISP